MSLAARAKLSKESTHYVMYRRMHWFFKFLLWALTLLFFWVLFTELIPRLLPVRQVANTEIWGVQLQSEVWQGTIRVTGDVVTPHGASITLLPGTRVIIAHDSDRSNLDFLPWHLRVGLNQGKPFFGVNKGEYFWDSAHKIQMNISKLVAIGTKEQPIVISSDSPPDQASPFDINSIYVDQGVLSHVNLSNYRKLEIGDKVTVRDSTFNNSVECAICIGNVDPSVFNNYFAYSLREDIWVGGGSPRITDNFFSANSPVGIRNDPENFGAAIISHNIFEMPMRLAIDLVSGDEDRGGEISYNIFSSSSLFKIPCDSKMHIEQNSLLGMITFSSGARGGCAQTMTMGANYWGLTELDRIFDERILQKDRHFNLIIPQILNTAPATVGPRPQ